MRTSARVATLGVTVLALAPFPVANASAATYNGTVTGSSGWYHEWSFAGPSASMTGSLSSATHNVYSGAGQNMKQPPLGDPPDPFWGGIGDYTSVYTPTDIKDVQGVTVQYDTSTLAGGACEGVTGPSTSGAQVSCGVVDTLTFTFSHPVTDATLHVMNIGATDTVQSAWVRLTNTSGQSISELSSGASNFAVNGSTIEPDFAVTSPNLGSHATGAGSVKVEGTYTSVTFAVDLEWYSIATASPRPIGEGVAFNWTLTDPPPTPPTPPAPPVDNGELVVKAASTSTKLKAGKKKTVVSSAYVTPSSAGSLKSISVTCRPKSKSLATRGDVSYCSYTKNLKTGKVTVTPYRKGLSIKVKVKAKSTDSKYQAESWAKTWTS